LSCTRQKIRFRRTRGVDAAPRIGAVASVVLPAVFFLSFGLLPVTAPAQLDNLRRLARELDQFDAFYKFSSIAFSWNEKERTLQRIVVTDGFSIVANPGGKTLAVRCDSAVVWFDPKWQTRLKQQRESKGRVYPRPFYEQYGEGGRFADFRSILGIYAEGDVFLEFDDQTIRAERLYLDTVLNRIIVIHGYVSTVLTQGPNHPPIPFHARAEELRIHLKQLGPDLPAMSRAFEKIHAKDVSVTSCSFGIPHYHIHASEIRVDPQEDEYMTVGIDHATLNVREVPVFYLPHLWGRSSIVEYFPLQAFSFGSNRRFGTYLFTLWGDDIRMKAKDGKSRKWGDWSLNLDWRSDRGPATGLTIDYSTDDYHGYVTGYYIKDRGVDISNGGFVPPSENRGRVRAFHRQNLPWELQLDLEYSCITDRNFLYEYFEGEARTGKIQETYARLLRDWNNMTVRLLYRPRINDFYTRAEYLPGLSGHVFSQPVVPGGFLGTNLYLDVDGSVSKNNIEFDEALGLDNFRTDRADVNATAELPVHLGPIHFNPFLSGRYTAWSATPLDDDGEDRHAWSCGFRLHSLFWRTYKGGLFGLDLRHFIQPQVYYDNRFDVSLSPDDLLPIDDVELLRETESVLLRVQNKLQVYPGKHIVDIMELNLENILYPDEERDNNGEAVGPLYWDFKAGYAPWLFVSDGLYDWNERDFLAVSVGLLGVLPEIPGLPKSDAMFFVGHRFARRVADVTTANLTARLGEKWRIGAYFQYDFRHDNVMGQRYVVGRTFHRFRLEVEYFEDGPSGDHGFRFAFAPVEFFATLQRERQRFANGQFIGDY